MIMASVCRVAPGSTEWYLCNFQTLPRTGATAALFAILCPKATVTMTIASPGVITWTAHPLVNGDTVILTTTGALPTGLTAGSKYYVVGATTNTFNLALTRGGTAINTTGSQSGVHTGQCFTFGNGDGSTTFNVPDLRGRMIVSTGTGTKALSLPGTAISSSQITVNATSDLQQGMKVLYTGASITGLTTLTNYYVIIIDSTHIQLASTQANANAATAVPLSISGTPSTDTLTYTLSARNIGDTGGEETHGMSVAELAGHNHANYWDGNRAGGGANAGGMTVGGLSTGGSVIPSVNSPTGGDTQHNNMPPFLSLYYYIHI